MNNEVFLVDSNTFITPYKTYYPFDIAPSFWMFLRENIENGNIVILSKVYEEVERGKDSLSEWLQNIDFAQADHRVPKILAIYGQVLTHIQDGESPLGTHLYNEKALREWADNDRADGWLIATAKAESYTLISFEKPNSALGTSASSHPKIPDVAAALSVECRNLYDMMRALGFTFK